MTSARAVTQRCASGPSASTTRSSSARRRAARSRLLRYAPRPTRCGAGTRHSVRRTSTARCCPEFASQRRWVPLAAVGIYVPRGLVSSLIMTAVPAQVAGVGRIVVCTPPRGAGLVAAAAELLGVDEVWVLGGPPAIAALAYGTETIARVDKIVGPGSGYVNEAKLIVARDVAIDLPAGPSEVVVVDGSRRRPTARGSRDGSAARARSRLGGDRHRG